MLSALRYHNDPVALLPTVFFNTNRYWTKRHRLSACTIGRAVPVRMRPTGPRGAPPRPNGSRLLHRAGYYTVHSFPAKTDEQPGTAIA
jgi:hypothetical protein